MSDDESRKRASVLNPIERVSEIIFGVLMALTFTGSLSVATAGRQDIQTMMLRKAHRLIADALPDQIADDASEDALEALRKRLVQIGAPRARLGADNYAGALGVFVLVVLATFPVVIPFMFIGESAVALRVSNFLALAALFVGGYMLGRYAGGSPWRYGFGMAGIGVVLVIAIIALGG